MRRVVGLTAGSTIGRGWFCGLAIFAGWFIAGREDPVGLSAALLILVCLTSYFASAIAVRPSPSPRTRCLHDPSSRRPRHPAPACAFSRPRSRSAAGESGDAFKPQNEFKLDPWINLPGPFDINKAVFYLFVATALTIGMFMYVANRMQARPNRVQTLVELSYTFMRDNIAGGNMDRRMAAKWFPFIAAIFLFIWFSNMIGLHPAADQHRAQGRHRGHRDPEPRDLRRHREPVRPARPDPDGVDQLPTSRASGPRASPASSRGLIPAGVEGPAKAPIFVIELISDFVRLVSLSVRLFANILAGHLLILFMGGGLVVLLNLGLGGSLILGIVTFPIAAAFFLFEVGLVATLQAFIFATLTAIYLGGAVAEDH